MISGGDLLFPKCRMHKYYSPEIAIIPYYGKQGIVSLWPKLDPIS